MLFPRTGCLGVLRMTMVKTCDKYCKGCVYCQLACGDTMFCCTYYLKTSIRRPCPAGTGCTVKRVGKAKGAWEYQNEAKWQKAKLERERARDKARREKKKENGMYIAVCPICGAEFQTHDHRKLYCSKACSTRAKTRTNNEYKRRKRNEAKSISCEAGSIATSVL